MTNEERTATIGSLLRERAGYEARGQTERVAQVDAQLRLLGVEAKIKSERAERRPSVKRAKEKRG